MRNVTSRFAVQTLIIMGIGNEKSHKSLVGQIHQRAQHLCWHCCHPIHSMGNSEMAELLTPPPTFYVGIDVATGDDLTAVCVMQRMDDGSSMLVGMERMRKFSRNKALHIVNRALMSIGLPPSKHRSLRVIKKLNQKYKGYYAFTA